MFILVNMSFTNIINSNEALGSPCLAPNSEFILFDKLPLCLTADLTTIYIAFSALVIFLNLHFVLVDFARKIICLFCHNIFRNQ